MANRPRMALALTLGSGLVLGALFQGNVSAQFQPATVQSPQRFTIEQNGVVLGTLEVPAGIDFRAGTVVSPDGRVGDTIVHIGQSGTTTPVVITLTEGARLR